MSTGSINLDMLLSKIQEDAISGTNESLSLFIAPHHHNPESIHVA